MIKILKFGEVSKDEIFAGVENTVNVEEIEEISPPIAATRICSSLVATCMNSTLQRRIFQHLSESITLHLDKIYRRREYLYIFYLQIIYRKHPILSVANKLSSVE